MSVLFKDILKIEFAKNIHDTIKYSMASIQKKTVDESFWSAGMRNMVSQHLEVTGWPRRLIARAFQQAPGSQMEHETLLGQGHRAKVLETSVCLTTCIVFELAFSVIPIFAQHISSPHHWPSARPFIQQVCIKEQSKQEQIKHTECPGLLPWQNQKDSWKILT